MAESMVGVNQNPAFGQTSVVSGEVGATALLEAFLQSSPFRVHIDDLWNVKITSTGDGKVQFSCELVLSENEENNLIHYGGFMVKPGKKFGPGIPESKTPVQKAVDLLLNETKK